MARHEGLHGGLRLDLAGLNNFVVARQLRAVESSSQQRLPPIATGLPLIGSTHRFVSGRTAFLRECHERLGPVFGLRLGPRRAAVLVGPAHHEFFFRESLGGRLSMREPYRFLRAMLDDEVGFAVDDPDSYADQRALFKHPLSAAKMSEHLVAMADETDRWLDGLADGGRMDIVAQLVGLSQRIATRCLLGEDLYRRIGDEFYDLYADLVQGVSVFLPPWLPLPRMLRCHRAKRKMQAILRPLLAERRRMPPDTYDDTFQHLATSRKKDGSLYSDERVIATIIGLIFAGHETTAAQMSWTLIQLLDHPGYLATVMEQLDAAGPLGPSPSTLRRLDRLHLAAKETERMHPSADVIPRVASEDIEIGGYRIPRGWFVLLAPAVSHRMPELFERPDAYDPLRFAAPRREDQQHRHALIGFGGGVRRCTGVNFAYVQIMVVIGKLLQRFELRRESGEPPKTIDKIPPTPASDWVEYRTRPWAMATATQEVVSRR